MSALEAFIMFGVCMSDYFRCTLCQPDTKRYIVSELCVDGSFPNQLLTLNIRLLNHHTFNQHHWAFAEECSRYFAAGNTKSFDMLLQLFSGSVERVLAQLGTDTLEL